MSMEISGLNTQNSSVNYLQPKKAEDNGKEFEANVNIADNSKFDLPKDRYISHEDDETATKGIYKMNTDKNGKSKIVFEKTNPAKVKNDNQTAKKTEKSAVKQCTGSTDKVDSEIKRLKNQKQQIERQINNVSEEEADKLRQELDRINGELMQKDNDSYRRSHTVFTQS